MTGLTLRLRGRRGSGRSGNDIGSKVVRYGNIYLGLAGIDDKRGNGKGGKGSGIGVTGEGYEVRDIYEWVRDYA